MRCFVNADWREQGIASIVAFKDARGFGQVMGAFLVDLWCFGLKDAWGRTEVTGEEIDRTVNGRMKLEPLDLAVAQRLVAGAIAFSRKNGFRLPVNYERWTAMLGITSETPIDLSEFGIDGGLRYVGEIEDLQSRLIYQSVDEFLHRPDVKYIAGLGAPVGYDVYEEAEEDHEDTNRGTDAGAGGRVAGRGRLSGSGDRRDATESQRRV